VAIPNPEHLFEQADTLIALTHAGAPRQANLRRAASSAYYGLFHFILAAAADAFVGATQRTTGRYALVYRSINHAWLSDLCREVMKPTLPRAYNPYVPTGFFGFELRGFAASVVELQERRHSGDYDPLAKFRASDARLSVSTARGAIEAFHKAADEQRRMFLTLLVCRPR
jgi:hypothetical protein